MVSKRTRRIFEKTKSRNSKRDRFAITLQRKTGLAKQYEKNFNVYFRISLKSHGKRSISPKFFFKVNTKLIFRLNFSYRWSHRRMRAPPFKGVPMSDDNIASAECLGQRAVAKEFQVAYRCKVCIAPRSFLPPGMSNR